MLRGAIWLLLAFAGAVVLALVLRANHGNVAILWPPYRVELSSNMALILTILAFFVLHVILLAIGKTLAMPQRIRSYRERRREQRSNRALQGAVLALFEGRYDRAEKLAATAASASRDSGEGAGAAALVAARSAHRLGAPQRRDDWMRQAAQSGPTNAAALMVQAEFALDDQQPARALDAVDRMSAGGAQQPIALETALGAYQQSGQWERVLETVRQLSKRGRMSTGEAAALRVTAYRQLLVPREGDARAIRELWKSMRSDERKATELAAPTVAALARAAAPEDARKISLGVLDAGYDEATVEAYGAMAALPPRQRLEQLERWRGRHGDKPKLLEMLARVCASEKLWGKAETYLLGSLASGDTVSARVALAQLYESIDRPRDAALQFQLAARLALGERPALPGAAIAAPPVPGPDQLTGIGASSALADGGGSAGAGAGAAAGVATGAAAGAAAGIGTGAASGRGAGSASGGPIGHAAGNTPVGPYASLPPRSDATPAVNLETGAGDELGLIGRKE